jgi:serine/threonine protein kinase
MQDSETTSGRLSQALFEDLLLERDRLRALYSELYPHGGFPGPELCRALFDLAKSSGVLPALAGLARPWLDSPTPERFEQAYLSRLKALAASGGSTSGVRRALPVDLFDYLDAALPKSQPGQSFQVLPDTVRVERLLRFLNSAATDPALVLFRKSLPEMPPDSASAAAIETPPESPQISRVVGSYQILEEIGRGGMGTVHVAWHTLLRKRFAVKILRNLPAEGEERERAVARFTREARIYHELAHPNIVRLHEIFAHEGELLIVMEYVPGQNLRKAIDVARRLSPSRVLQIGIDVGEALQAARSRDIIHRDPKPENILVTPDGHYKITDFGIARIVRETGETRVTEEKTVLGTVGYMSPEAIRGEEVDEQADIYSLGAVLYHAATGLIPCYAPDPSSMMYFTLHKDPRPISVLVDGFPAALEAIILRCLRKSQDERTSGYPELLDALYEVRKDLEGNPSDAPLQKPARRKTLPLAAFAFGVPAVVAFVWAFGALRAQAPTPAPSHSPLRASEVPAVTKAEPPPPPPPAPAPELRPEPPLPPPEPKPPAPTLKERLLASRPSDEDVRRIEAVLTLFERRYPEITSLSYAGLAEDLAGVTVEARSPAEPLLAAGRTLVRQADSAFRSRLAELEASGGPVSLKLREGGSASVLVESLGPSGLRLWEYGTSVAIPLARISPEEFRPRGVPPGAELAFLTLSVSPSAAIPILLALSEKNEEFLLWLPVAVRLARLEVERDSRLAAEEARPVILKKISPDSSTAALAHASSARAALGRIDTLEDRLASLFPYLARDFGLARREAEALELLFHRQLSPVVVGFRETASGPVAEAVILELFEHELDAASDELLAGTGWFNWRWELRPWDKNPIVRARFLVPGPSEGPLVLQDPEGPRSLVMNGETSRAPEGVLIRLKVEPLGPGTSEPEWRLALLSETPGTTTLRVTAGALELIRSTLSPGAADERLSRIPLSSGPELMYHSYALIPAGEHFHVYRDRVLVLSLPLAEAAIPKQLVFTIYHAKASIQSFQAKPTPARGESRK